MRKRYKNRRYRSPLGHESSYARRRPLLEKLSDRVLLTTSPPVFDTEFVSAIMGGGGSAR